MKPHGKYLENTIKNPMTPSVTDRWNDYTIRLITMWYATTIITIRKFICAMEIITSSIVFSINQNKPTLPPLSMCFDFVAGGPLPAAVLALTRNTLKKPRKHNKESYDTFSNRQMERLYHKVNYNVVRYYNNNYTQVCFVQWK